MGMYTLSIMTEMSHSSYIVHAESFAVLFTNILSGITDLKSNLAYYTVITMKNLVPLVTGHQQVSRHVRLLEYFKFVGNKNNVEFKIMFYLK